jgi:hypothetical protein
MNGHANCIYAICCPPRSPQQKEALAIQMEKALSFGSSSAIERRKISGAVAEWILENFDLAPVGALQPFKDAIARLARENPTSQTPIREGGL